jgi:hypothetical protein
MVKAYLPLIAVMTSTSVPGANLVCRLARSPFPAIINETCQR